MNMNKQLDEMLSRCLSDGDYAGVCAGVYQRGKCLYNGCFGMADREAGRPMQQDTIFRIYSMSKPVTAVAVMQLIEQGKLHPDLPLSMYIPEFRDPMVCEPDGTLRPAKREILIRDLLSMSSGLCYPNCISRSQRETAALFGQMEASRQNGEDMTTLELCRGLAKIPLAFDPGTHWEYGTSADVLGGVVEVVSGKRYRDYLRDAVFDPLGMEDTDFFVPAEKQARFAAAYQMDEHRTILRDDGCYLGLTDYSALPAFQSGGAGLVSTIPDYAKFAGMLANGGISDNGVRLLSRRAVEFICTPQISSEVLRRDQDWDSLRGYDYGCLVRVLTDKAAAGTIADPGEFGWDGWTGTYFCVDPGEQLSILFMIQLSCAGTSLPAKLMRNIVYANLE